MSPAFNFWVILGEEIRVALPFCEYRLDQFADRFPQVWFGLGAKGRQPHFAHYGKCFEVAVKSSAGRASIRK